jgi:SOS-response transcriptional repressor LexA
MDAHARPGHRYSPMTTPRPSIPIRAAKASNDGACAGAEPYALMVLGDSMRPEFDAGDIIVVEPDGIAVDGSFVVARYRGEWLLCALRAEDSHWRLATLDGATDVAIADLAPIHGVVIQKSKPGRRRAVKRYVD